MNNRKNSPAVQALKTQAKGLRKHLKDQGVDFTHSQALEAVAHSHGHKDWNTAVAEVDLDDAVQEAEDLRTELKTKPFRLEHLVYPSGTSLADTRVRKRVDHVVVAGGSVLYLDFAMALDPEQWVEPINSDRFILVQPESFKEVVHFISTACSSGVGLVVLSHPRVCLFGDGTIPENGDWERLLGSLRETEGTTVLAVNSFRVKEDSMSSYLGYAPWTRMADQEWVIDPSRKFDGATKTRYCNDMRCPTCLGPLERRPGMFHSNKTGSMAGLICEPCNALWDDPTNSFIEAHA